MSKAMHTPGEWFINGTNTLYIESRIRDGWLQEICAVGPTQADSGYGEQQLANARLIVAAPDLLEALARYVQQDLAHGMTDNNLHRTARAAIAKATGEQA